MRRALIALAVAAAAALALAPPAAAHNVLVASDPAKGSSIPAGPPKVTLTFDQYVQAADVNEIAVTGPGGGQWAEGPVEVQGNAVTATLRPLGPAGEYIIGYRILSADGHSVSDEIRFTLTQAGNGTPASADAAKSPGAAKPASGESDSTGVPLWVWIAGAVVLLAIGLVVALRLGKEPAQK
ncbi:copper resistance CopC family protein [Amycolatopsis suaedae]|uniref:Copper resistance protein CopC n=1 Tax=Amycolatopsis suaedae TaxID=2510978 RepID=A0A4Q7J741_9PSEU|nr:copper resistance CopC family protein [Amycolatopsis suaedae]RZQ62163.1 copper resistance protein CopC [Amycolatopsis suaedae]